MDRIGLNQQTNLGETAILTIWAPSVHDHEMSFCLLNSSLISLSSVLQCSRYKSYFC